MTDNKSFGYESLTREVSVIAGIFTVGTVIAHNPIRILRYDYVKVLEGGVNTLWQVWFGNFNPVDAQLAAFAATDNVVTRNADYALD